ncbi:hypothetical protein [Ligilactobacillus aviarius]|uniref:Uncharacterized protein n=1 Tax=Ligilactobacillus aviarius TaxID=1606 RepID=A0A510WUP4_9LACO|nr:hypothetical protein [Ligilactobacillus aviarius]KRM38738.1 hypothetical protein FC33_GL000242 [Ligilactobacillus aviarius subsp. aviarius DSM 20655]GEK42341.1 hypothetical protein LAV01_11730 [Ligilactobacillus aviarius]
MEKWNFAFNLMSMLASIGTFGTFIFLLYDKISSYKKIQEEKNAAIDDLENCKAVSNELLKLLSNAITCTYSNSMEKIEELSYSVSLVLSYKIIGNDIHNSLFYLINKMSTIKIYNNILEEEQRINLEKYVEQITKYVNLAIKRLQKKIK